LILNVIINDKPHPLEVPDDVIKEGDEFFRKMDHDMDKGWQMSREWVDNPDKTQRCQIAADKLYSAISAENETMVTLMAGYIMTRMPNITSVDIDTHGDMLETIITTNDLP
jgi:hypothetical protein